MRPWLSAPQQLVESIGDAERVFPVEYDRLIVVPGILRRADDRKVPCREPAYNYRPVLPPGRPRALRPLGIFRLHRTTPRALRRSATRRSHRSATGSPPGRPARRTYRSEEHTSELQSLR